MTGKPMSGWVMVTPEGVEDDSELAKWIQAGDEYSSSLQSKKMKLRVEK